MSSHADTIREAGELWRTQAADLAEWSMRASDMKALASALLAENQRLRDALERIEQVACEFGYTGDERDSCACPACETLVIAREALAGDGE